MAQEFFELLNKNRADAGKYEYILDSTLTDWAMERAAQCCICFTHATLSGDSKKTDGLGDFQDKYSLNNIPMQENIAEGLADAQSTYTVWYNSNGHRPLLTDTKNYKYCGIGVVTYHGQKGMGSCCIKCPGWKYNWKCFRFQNKHQRYPLQK